MKGHIRTFGIVLGVALLAASGSPAQQPAAKAKQPSVKAKPNTPAQSDRVAAREASAVELADDVFRLENVGLAIHLPIGALSQKSRAGNQVTAQITPAPGQPQWLLNIQTPQSTTGATTRQVADEVLEQIRAQFGVAQTDTDRSNKTVTRVVRSDAVILEPVKAVPLQPNGLTGEGTPYRFYVKTPAGSGKGSIVRGYTVFALDAKRFVVFDLSVPEPEFAKVRPIYERVIATAVFDDPAAISANRGASIALGAKIFESLTPSDYDAALTNLKDTWYRLYKPAPAGAGANGDRDAAELGYFHVRAWKGMRGEVDASRDKSKWDASDREPGYFVKIEARQMQGDAMIDSVGTYFMGQDRKNEVWVLQVASRDVGSRRLQQTFTETAARAGASLSVTVSGNAEGKTIQPVVPESGYLSQVEMFLLPQLLVRKHAEARAKELGFYTYQSEFGAVRYRRDAIAPDEQKAGSIRITTKINEDREPYVSLYNEKGELTQTTMADGSVRAPIELPRLLDLWKAKGLPVE